jgi:transposase
LESAETPAPSYRTGRDGHPALDQNRLAQGKKNATRIGAALVFIDESGLLMAPHVRRTWAPRGQTPILWQRTNSYRKVSAISALVVSPRRDRVQLFFGLHPNANIDSAAVLTFLKNLNRHLQCPISLIWDRFMCHRAKRVQNFIAQQEDWQLNFLPPYAPELNPVENVWSYLKTKSMVNDAAFDLDALTRSTRYHSRTLQKRETLLRSFLKHTLLFLRLK